MPREKLVTPYSSLGFRLKYILTWKREGRWRPLRGEKIIFRKHDRP